MSNQIIYSKLKQISINCEHSKYWNISYSLGEILKDKVKQFSPTNILEIGTSNGFSTLWLCLGTKSQNL